MGKDVATALGYKNPQEAIRTHVDDDDKGVSEILTPGGKQPVPIINESGLYSTGAVAQTSDGPQVPPLGDQRGYCPASARLAGTPPQPDPRAAGPGDGPERPHPCRANLMTRLWNAAGVRPADQALALNGYFDGLSLPREAFGEACNPHPGRHRHRRPSGRPERQRQAPQPGRRRPDRRAGAGREASRP